MKSETTFIRKYPEHGYEIRTEVVDPEGEGNTVEMKSAYTKSGAYIGGARDGRVLCEEKGIKPETIDSGHNVCSIGFCEAEQKWYGWSHRAIFGFGIGSSVKKGDCAYIPSKEDIAKECKQNGSEFEILRDGDIMIVTLTEDDTFTIIPGRGRWTAKNLDDARQMAIDFANGVA